MKYISRPYIFIAVISLSILCSCATTKLKSVWSDPSYQGGPLLRVFVMGLAKDQRIRRMYEDEFVRQLKTRGTQGIPSYSVIPQDKIGDENFIDAKIRELRVDAVLVTRLVDVKTIEKYYPPEMYYVPAPYYRGWRGYYRSGYQYMVTPGYMTRDKTVVLETNLYSAQTDQLIWSALSETFLEGSAQSLISSLVSKLVDDMAAKDLIP